MAATSSRQPKVVVAPAYLALLRSLLSDVDCEVEIAFDGQQVLDLARRMDPALLLLGADTPGLDGFRVCELVKSAPATQALPVVLVTARASAEDHQRALECGADDVLTKPISRTELLARVRSHIRMKNLSDQVGAAEAALFRVAAEVETRAGQAPGHAERVALTSRMLGEKLGLSVDDRELLYRGGLLHDLGLICVPESILRKPGPLDAAEMAVMARHAEHGEEMVASLQAGGGLRTVLRHHHERIDGRGYPDGLRGGAIPLLARALSVCDAYDALLNDRAHRARRSPHQAIAILRRDGGRRWDPHLVELFVNHVAPLQDRLRSGTGGPRLSAVPAGSWTLPASPAADQSSRRRKLRRASASTPTTQKTHQAR